MVDLFLFSSCKYTASTVRTAALNRLKAIPGKACSLYQVHEFLPSLLCLEHTRECGCCGYGILLLHTAHLHAHVCRLYDNNDTHRMQGLLYDFHNLMSHSLLHLQASCEDFHNACYLGKPCDCSVWDVCHMHFPVERQHVCSHIE